MMMSRRGDQGEDDEVFTVLARRCKRCGGLLTSKQAVADGYGHVCKIKAFEEARTKRPIEGQLTLGIFETEEE